MCEQRCTKAPSGSAAIFKQCPSKTHPVGGPLAPAPDHGNPSPEGSCITAVLASLAKTVPSGPTMTSLGMPATENRPARVLPTWPRAASYGSASHGIDLKYACNIWVLAASVVHGTPRKGCCESSCSACSMLDHHAITTHLLVAGGAV